MQSGQADVYIFGDEAGNPGDFRNLAANRYFMVVTATLAILWYGDSDSCHEFVGCRSGCDAQPGVGKALVDRVLDRVERGAQFGWRVGLGSGGEQRSEDPVVDLGVEDREPDAVGSQGVAVVAGDAGDQAVAPQPGEVVAGLVHAVGGAEQSGHQGTQALVGDAGDGE